MAKRSLKASADGIRRAKQAFRRRGWTQQELATEVGLETRQPIWKFFSGRPVERAVFVDICFRLDLEWEDIFEPEVWDEDEMPSSDPVPQGLAGAVTSVQDAGFLGLGLQEADGSNPRGWTQPLATEDVGGLGGGGAGTLQAETLQAETLQAEAETLRLDAFQRDAFQRDAFQRDAFQLQPSQISRLGLAEVAELKRRVAPGLYARYDWLPASFGQPLPLSRTYVPLRVEVAVGNPWRARSPRDGGTAAQSWGLEQLEHQGQRWVLQGGPGSGKSTSLRRILLECLAGRFWVEYVPLLLELDGSELDGNRHLQPLGCETSCAGFIPSRSKNAKVLGQEGDRLEALLHRQWVVAGYPAEAWAAVWAQGRLALLIDGCDRLSPTAQARLCQQLKPEGAVSRAVGPILLAQRSPGPLGSALEGLNGAGFAVAQLPPLHPCQQYDLLQHWWSARQDSVEPGLAGPALAGPALAGPGLTGPGLAGPGLAGPGLAEPGLTGPGLTGPGRSALLGRNAAELRQLLTTPLLVHWFGAQVSQRVTQSMGLNELNLSELYQGVLDLSLWRWARWQGSPLEPAAVAERLQVLMDLARTEVSQFSQPEIQAIALTHLAQSHPGRSRASLWVEAEGLLQALVQDHGVLELSESGRYRFALAGLPQYLASLSWVDAFPLQPLGRVGPSGGYATQAIQHLEQGLADSSGDAVLGHLLDLVPAPEDLLTQLRPLPCPSLEAELAPFVDWLRRKQQAQSWPYRAAAVRAFYWDLAWEDVATDSVGLGRMAQGDGRDGENRAGMALDRAEPLATLLDSRLAGDLSGPLALDLALARLLRLGHRLELRPSRLGLIELRFSLDLDQRFSLDPALAAILRHWGRQFPDLTTDEGTLLAWWQNQGHTWLEELRQVAIEHRDLGHRWPWSAAAIAFLQNSYQRHRQLLRAMQSRGGLGSDGLDPVAKDRWLGVPLQEGRRNANPEIARLSPRPLTMTAWTPGEIPGEIPGETPGETPGGISGGISGGIFGGWNSMSSGPTPPPPMVSNLLSSLS